MQRSLVKTLCRLPFLRSIHSTAGQPTATMSTPSYADAITLLNSTQTGFRSLEQRRRDGITLDSQDPIGHMRRWLRYMGYEPRDLDRLNVVHVAGTKGKGTTCALTNSILEQYRKGEKEKEKKRIVQKTGLYTSPHLVAVRERIRINAEPISEAAFTRYFFEVWRALETGIQQSEAGAGVWPSYFRFLTLLSLHVFLREGVDAAIYEVGVGGELDATNVFEAPAATAVTTLGIDHVLTLGDTIESIAWHKAGVFKRDCPAFTIPQEYREEKNRNAGPEDKKANDAYDANEAKEGKEKGPMAVLQQRAAERGAPLAVLSPRRFEAALRDVRLAPANEPFQRKNAALAVQLAATVLRRLGADVDVDLTEASEQGAPSEAVRLPQRFVDGLEQVVWRGRCETKTTGRQQWYLDGAHNHQSLDVACQWFSHAIKGNTSPTILIFNQQSTRDALDLLRVVQKTVYSSGQQFQHAIFCTNVTFKDNSWKVDFVNKNVDPDELKNLTLQRELADSWKKLDPETKVHVAPTIEDAVDVVRSIGGGQIDTRTLITGSFHLIGGALTVLEGGEGFAHASISSVSSAGAPLDLEEAKTAAAVA